MNRSGGFREWKMRVFLGFMFITVLFQPFHSFQSCLFGETDNNPVRRYGIKAVPCDPRTDFKEIFLVRNWESIPHKNQEESRSQCDADNKMLGHNRVDYSPRFPVMACLAFGASTVADWWSKVKAGKEGTTPCQSAN